MKSNQVQLCFVVGAILVVILVIWLCTSWSNKSTEGFTSVSPGAIDNVGTLLDDSYDLIRGPEHQVPAPHFADLVPQADNTETFKVQEKEGDGMRPMERLHRVQGSALMPRTSTHTTPFNVDVANPTSHAYMVNTPRATSAIKSRYKDYSLSSMIRGDIPITYNPNIPLVGKTVQGRDDLRLDGLFTDHFAHLYNKYTGKERRNLVTKVAGAGQAGGYGGASGGVIMDA